MFKTTKHLLLIAALLLTLMACSQDNPTNSVETSVSIENPVVRSTPPGQKVTGAFMVLKNNTSTGIDLIEASSPVAKVTEIHETSMQDGVMKMNHVGQIAIPANGQTELKPGGLHVMLMDLKEQLKEGEFIKLELKFSDQSTQTLDVPIVKAGH